MKPKYFLADKTFERAFSKYKSGLGEADRKKLVRQFEMFSEDIFDKRLRTHKLKGALSEYYAFSISYSDRIVFRVLEDGGVFLVDIGSHDEVY
jgi:mRNA-degrading endonuclease YafQ of YafQ-DinJ toxin-antitoxin module